MSREVDRYIKLINLHTLTFRLDFSLTTFDISFMIPYASVVITNASALLFTLPQFQLLIIYWSKVFKLDLTADLRS